jgi:hypothetical protein
MLKTAVVLGKREGAFLRDLERQRRTGFWLEGHHLREVINFIRYVDDATPASGVLCRRCVKEAMDEFWGRDLDISEESCAQVVDFLDGQERFFEGRFLLRARDRGDVTAEGRIPPSFARYTPRPWAAYPVRYLKGLLTGKLARVQQITPGDEDEGFRHGWYMIVELTSSTCNFSWEEIVAACTGHRMRWAKRVFSRLRFAAETMRYLDA